jgi:hypothetical protein
MKMAMLAGVNFLRLGLCDEAAADPLFLERPVSVRFPRAMVAALAAPALFRKTAWPTLKFLLADPVPYMREKLGFEQERAHRRQAESYSDSTQLDPTRRSQLGGRNIQPVDALQNQRAGSAGA